MAQVTLSEEHIYLCAGLASEISGVPFRRCLPDNRSATEPLSLAQATTISLLNGGLNVSQAVLIRRLKVSGKALSRALHKVTDDREQRPPFDGFLSAAELYLQAQYRVNV